MGSGAGDNGWNQEEVEEAWWMKRLSEYHSMKRKGDQSVEEGIGKKRLSTAMRSQKVVVKGC